MSASSLAPAPLFIPPIPSSCPPRPCCPLHSVCSLAPNLLASTRGQPPNVKPLPLSDRRPPRLLAHAICDYPRIHDPPVRIRINNLGISPMRDPNISSRRTRATEQIVLEDTCKALKPDFRTCFTSIEDAVSRRVRAIFFIFFLLVNQMLASA
jgi:hypothetical protein